MRLVGRVVAQFGHVDQPVVDDDVALHLVARDQRSATALGAGVTIGKGDIEALAEELLHLGRSRRAADAAGDETVTKGVSCHVSSHGGVRFGGVLAKGDAALQLGLVLLVDDLGHARHEHHERGPGGADVLEER
jgi:hypothetical protein